MAYDVDEIKRKVDIVEVIGHYVPLKKKGGEYVGLCPFHADNNPSMYVNRNKAMAHCFGCGAHHDIISFIQEKEGLDFKAACERLGGKNEWTPSLSTPIAPAAAQPERITSKPPVDAPAPDMSLSSLGEPVKIFPLKDLDGSIICYEARYDDPNDKSRMWSWGARPGQKPRWACGHPNLPRPLYGLDRIRMSPDINKILITEGPKKADSAHRLLGAHYICISWTGGAGAMDKHDWTIFAGYGFEFLLWPDADRQICKGEREALKYGCAAGDVLPYEHQPGQAAMYRLAEILIKQGARVRILNVEGMSAGWDIADAEEEGWDLNAVIEWAQPRASDYSPAPLAAQEGDEPPAYATEQAPLPDENELPPAPNPRVKDIAKKSVTANRYVTPPPPPGSYESRIRSVVSVMGNEVIIRPIKWLWPGRFALGKISMIVGEPGLGKSQVCSSIASIVSNGGKWPADRAPSVRGSVIILSAEDDPQDTLAPRLIAAGADMSKICMWQGIRVFNNDGSEEHRLFSIMDDCGFLEAKIDEIGDVRLVIIDPVSAYMGAADSHKNSETRVAMYPIQKLAEKRNFAVIFISHLNKNAGYSALNRVQGSVGMPAASRAVWGVTKDQDNPLRRLFMPIKNNIGIDHKGLAYTIEGYEIRSDDEGEEGEEGTVNTSCIMWENELVDKESEDAFKVNSDEDREDKSDAQHFLRSTLNDGPVTVATIEREAKGAGYQMHMLRKVAKKMDILMAKENKFGGKWYWSLPGKPGRAHTVH